MVIKILDHIKTASSYEDGEAIYRLILPSLLAGEKVEVDFSGVLSIPSSFVNSAFIRLLDDVSFNDIKTNLVFKKSTRQINSLILSRFDFVTQGGKITNADG
jgi:hypothetical protein